MFLIINGPNLNLLGKREPEIYGTTSMEKYFADLCKCFPDDDFIYFQNNSEGEIIDKIHWGGYSADDCKGIIINPGAYAHYSYAIADALMSVGVPAVEVHISNIMAREEHRRKSVTASACRAMICGCGLKGYELAVAFLKTL